MDLLPDEVTLDDDPIDVVEAVISNDDRFEVERGPDGDLTFSTRGLWAEITGAFAWREELPAVLMTVSMDLVAPKEMRTEAARLTVLINEHLWLGHFDFWLDDGSIVFRQSVPMLGRGELMPHEAHVLIATALDAADRFYPAYLHLFREGGTAEDAARAAIFETIGEA